MRGDQYQVFSASGGHSTLHGTLETWAEAKELRNSIFHGDGKIRAAWIMQINPSMQIQPRRWGNTMRRTRKEAQCTVS